MSAASAADGPGQADHPEAFIERRAHELIAGIGDERRAGIGDERHRLPGADAGEEPRPLPRRIVLVIGREFGTDAEMAEQLAAVPRVLRRDQFGAGEHGERAQRDVAEIADRRRHEIEAGFERLREEIGQRFARPLHHAGRRIGLLWLLLLHA